MRTKIMLPLAIAAIMIAAVGAVSLNWNTSLGFHGRQHGQVNDTTVFGWNYQNMSYNAITINTIKINRTTELKELGTVAQCRTTFIDTAAPIASNALNITLNTSEVNAANAVLQSDLTSNAPTLTIKSDIMVFDGSALRLFGEAVRAAQKLNQTQIQSLRAQLNGSVQTLQNCTSTTIGAKGHFGFGRFGNFLRGFGNWNFLRRFRLGFHYGARIR